MTHRDLLIRRIEAAERCLEELRSAVHRSPEGPPLTAAAVETLAAALQGVRVAVDASTLPDDTLTASFQAPEEQTSRPLSALLDMLPVAVIVTDANGKTLQANRLAEAILGSALTGTIEQPERSYTTHRPDGSPLPAEETPLSRALDGEVVEGVEMLLRRPNGEECSILCAAAPVHSATEEIVGGIVLFQDISELKRGEKYRDHLLEENRRRCEFLERLLYVAPMGIAVIRGPEHRYELVNPYYQAIPGTLDNPRAGRTVVEVFPDVVAQGILDMVDNVYRTGQAASARAYRAAAGTGQAGMYWTIDYTPLRAADGTIDGVLIVAKEITEEVLVRKGIEDLGATLAQERDTLQAIMDSTHAQVAYLDPQFNFVRVNAAYVRGCGYRVDELIGRNHFDLFPNAENQVIFEQVRDTGEAVAFKAKSFKFPGRSELGITYWDWTLVPLKGKDNVVQGLVLSLIDVTERERARQQREAYLARLDKLLEISQQILAEKTAAGLMQRMADAARELTGARIAVLGYSLQDGTFQIGATSRAEDVSPFLSIGTLDVDKGAAYFELIAKEGFIRLTDEELQQRPAWWRLPKEHSPLHGLMGARLVTSEGQVCGVVMLTDKEGEFTDEDEAMLSQLATIASLGLQQIGAKEDAERHAEELGTVLETLQERTRNLGLLNQLGWELGSTLELQHVFERVLQATQVVIPANGSSIWLLDKAQPDQITCRAAIHPESTRSPVGISLHPGEGIVGWVVQHGQSTVAAPAHEDGRFTPYVDQQTGFHTDSILAVPLRTRDVVIGALEVANKQAGPFTDTDRGFLEILAAAAAISIENAQLYEEAQQAAAAAERSRLAHELHDAVSQNLFSASVIAESLPRIWEHNPARVQQGLQQLLQLTRGALAEMRSLLFELRPATLVQVELAELLNQLVEAASSRSRAEITLTTETMEGQCALPADVKIALYRIIQESLNNAIKYAQASKVTLAVRCTAGQVELRISDDGQGFDPSDVSPEHMGLKILHERAEEIGAQLEIESHRGQGTTVIVIWNERQIQGRNAHE